MNTQLISAGIFICCMFFAATVSAEGADVLAAIVPDVKATTEGSGKTILYVIAFFGASAAYIATKNILVFVSIFVIIIMFSFMKVVAFAA